MPFCIVQLAKYMYPHDAGYKNWLRLRDQQRLVAQEDPYAEAADIFDLGEENDIHPLRKKEVAQRIAAAFSKLITRH
jgi:sialate O-acetylesterase